MASSSSRLELKLTRTGTVVGTPAYMPPEQNFRQDTDGRSDQFSFAVVLFEALFGQRPFSGKSVDELCSAIMRQDFEDVDQSAAPRWLRRVVARGLKATPSERFPTMHAMVRELERRPIRARRIRRGVVAVLGLGALGVGGGWYADHERTAQCGAPEDGLGDLWSGGTGVAGHVGRTIDGRVEAFVATWRQERWAGCLATRVHGEQSVARFEAQQACLEARKLELRTVVELAPELEDVDAVRAVFGLRDPASCRAGTSDRSSAAADALARAGRLEEALGLLRDDDPWAGVLRAQKLWARGDRDVARVELHRAIAAADAAGLDAVAAQGWTALIKVEAARSEGERAALRGVRGSGRAARADGLGAVQTALAAVARAGDDPRLRARVRRAAAAVAGDPDVAAGYLRSALRDWEAVLGSSDPRVAATLDALADVAEVEAAVAHRLRALAIYEDLFGPEHPQTGRAARRLGESLLARGDEPQARAHLRRAERILGASR